MKKYQVIVSAADVGEIPDKTRLKGKLETQLLYGEIFNATKEKKGWLYGACAHDGYKGWIEKKNVSAKVQKTTHVVIVARTHIYRDASMKSPALKILSFGSRVTVAKRDGNFVKINGGWIYAPHLATKKDKDFVNSALKFFGTPYYWGGRAACGIDCSGLVQVVVDKKIPRDTGDQVKIGKAVRKPKRGDLIFWPGHVAIMADAHHVINADGFHMTVMLEALRDVVKRRGKVTAIRRI